MARRRRGGNRSPCSRHDSATAIARGNFWKRPLAAPCCRGFSVSRPIAPCPIVQRGRDLVSADLRADFDLIRKAFAEYDQGHDEAARQTLQSVGLQSPYLDWKLLLRGLLAWSANDDGRALENWQRLDPERLPARLAAPFRSSLEPAYRNALPPEEAKRVARRADQIGHPMLHGLRELQKLLGTPETLPRALNQVPSLLGMLKMSFPHLVPKLGNCFYWLIVQGGQPNDLDRYEKLFGRPPDDPEFFRLRRRSDGNVQQSRRSPSILEGICRLD